MRLTASKPSQPVLLALGLAPELEPVQEPGLALEPELVSVLGPVLALEPELVPGQGLVPGQRSRQPTKRSA